MTSKERVARAISLQEPDRVPIHDMIWGPAWQRWKKEGLSATDHFAVTYIIQITP